MAIAVVLAAVGSAFGAGGETDPDTTTCEYAYDNDYLLRDDPSGLSLAEYCEGWDEDMEYLDEMQDVIDDLRDDYP